MSGYLIAAGRCWTCRRLFTFDPDLVPSVGIDPQINAPADQEGGDPARAVYEPLCSECVEIVNRERVEQGQAPIVVLPGAYL